MNNAIEKMIDKYSKTLLCSGSEEVRRRTYNRYDRRGLECGVETNDFHNFFVRPEYLFYSEYNKFKDLTKTESDTGTKMLP